MTNKLKTLPSSTQRITAAFDRAAPRYDAAAHLQTDIASQLATYVTDHITTTPQTILDIGCGTGLTAQAAQKIWPQTSITGLDSAPAMLAMAKQQMPTLRTLCADAAIFDSTERYDLIVSSMMAHWLPDPLAAIARWQKWLIPNGHLAIALPLAGSLAAWENLCTHHNVTSGLWKFPDKHGLMATASRHETKEIALHYATAHDFLRSVKQTGAATARTNHTPADPTRLRQMLNAAPQPFPVIFRIGYFLFPARSP